MNFTPEPKDVPLGPGAFADVVSGEALEGTVTLDGYGVRVIERK